MMTITIDQQSVNQVKDYIRQESNKKIAYAKRALCDLGAECVKIAKNLPQNGSRAQYPVSYTQLPSHKPNYVDWTQNLRKSIGWAVLENGIEYKSDLGPIGNTRTYFQRIKNLKQYTEGLVLLIMATGKDPRTGEGYAGYVQALGYDVLASAELNLRAIAKKTISNMLTWK